MKRYYFFLTLILLFALYVRLDGLGWGLPSKTLSLTTYHPDEAYLFHSLEHMAKTRSLHPGVMGLLYGTFHFYTAGFFIFLAKLFGFLDIGSREGLLQNLAIADRLYEVPRLFSVLCGIVSVAGVYTFTRRIYSKTIAIFAAFFLSFYPASIAISHYAKVDALLVPLVIILLHFCLDLLEKPQFKNAVKCGFVTGLLASTKYNAGIFLLVPLSLMVLNLSQNFKERMRLSLAIVLFSLIAFILTTPYSLLDWPLFISCVMTQFSLVGGTGIWEVSTSYPSLRYLIFHLPFGVGWVSLILFIGVLPWFIFRRRKEENILLLGFLFYFLLISFSRQKLVSYLAPLLPFVAIFSGVALARGAQVLQFRFLKWGWVSLVLICHAAYGWSFAGLYAKRDSREQASHWLEKNVSKDARIGIIRSYYWTPGILRQKNPPYTLVKAGDDQASLEQSILGLSALPELPDYFVASELEIREYIRLKESLPQYAQAITQFFSNYEEIQSFELKPIFLGHSFWKRTPPWDFSMISPTIKIYRRKLGTDPLGSVPNFSERS